MLELKSEITEMRNSLELFNSKFEQTEESISELKGKAIEIIQSEEQKEKRMKRRAAKMGEDISAIATYHNRTIREHNEQFYANKFDKKEHIL